MLLVERKTLSLTVDEPARLELLDALRAAQFAPLIRTARRRSFELSLAAAGGLPPAPELIDDFERQALSSRLRERAGPYTPGDLFCSEDAIFYLAFGDDAARGHEAVVAGVVYDRESVDPLRRFELFCQRVRESMRLAGEGEAEAEAGELVAPPWESHDVRRFPRGLTRYVARQDEEAARAMMFREGSRERLRAAELLADERVRAFLRREQEARVEGYAPRLLSGESPSPEGLVPVEELVEAGLMRREVRVTCRKTRHPLFDLPTPDALALVTLSRARCSLCATEVADEVVEEVYNPTRLAAALLADGSWLRNRVYQIVRDLGVPESEIAAGPPAEGGESHLVANVCGDAFLFALRDGELSPSFSRRVVEAAGEIEARHVIVIVTGAAEGEGRMRLYEYAWRRAREGRDVDVAVGEGAAGARSCIEGVFERAVGGRLARDLCALDDALGMNASRLVLTKFKMRREQAGARRAETRRAARPAPTLPGQDGEESDAPPARLRLSS
ncbi:MAG TPA: hypothetical protein VF240_13050 [Pyrinomonadaceae bacterium]